MKYLHVSIRFFLFSAVLLLATLILDFVISAVYGWLLDYYALPKADSDITVMAFVISLFFIGLMSFTTGYWQQAKTAY